MLAKDLKALHFKPPPQQLQISSKGLHVECIVLLHKIIRRALTISGRDLIFNGHFYFL